MLLAVAATENEMAPFLDLGRFDPDRLSTLVCGVGPLGSGVRTARYLEKHHRRIASVVNFGVGGAYLHEEPAKGAGVLDICLATREVLGDYGVCFGLEIEPFADPAIGGPASFDLDQGLWDRAVRILQDNGIDHLSGTFVTVNGASGTEARGRRLRERFTAICENMEGAAIARACREFGLPLLEIRSISNLVEDRPGEPWRLGEAAAAAARTAALITQTLAENR